MKRLITGILSLVVAGGALASDGFEAREFFNVDKTKSFKAVLTGFDTRKNVVSMRKAEGRLIRFKVSHLCEEDQAYVKENAAALAAASGLSVDFDLYKGKQTRKKSDLERTVTTPAGYEISLRNSTKTDFENLKINYTIFHRKDAENGPTSIKQTPGSLAVSSVMARGSDRIKTAPVVLERYARKPSGGG
ncbi:MAG: hypothetical protein AAF514_01770 [Verrucomicrobiota bacterium]